MKTVKIVTILFGFLLSLCIPLGEARANVTLPAGATLTVSKIDISGLSNYRGHFLTVYYALGARASIANSKKQISIREVKIAETFPIHGDHLELPKRDLARSGIILPYSIIAFVIHSTPEFCWKNSNNQFPLGEKQCSSTTSIDIDSLMKTELDLLSERQNNPDVIRYRFGEFVSEN